VIVTTRPEIPRHVTYSVVVPVLNKHQGIMTYGVVEIKLHAFLISVQDRVKWPVRAPTALPLGERRLVTSGQIGWAPEPAWARC
jgi:hypothetical protein